MNHNQLYITIKKQIFNAEIKIMIQKIYKGIFLLLKIHQQYSSEIFYI